MLDFTSLITKKKSYGGANGNKKSVIYQNELYMLKLPNKAPINKNLSYANSAISEYLASKIFALVNIPVQETILGSYTHNDIKRLAVLCKDFEINGYRFYDFASLRNQVVDSKTEGHSTELKDIIDTFSNQDIIPFDTINAFFWKVFIIDALLGNWDRHNGNWGYLYNIDKDEVKIAPVFDNGSSLFPQADEKMMQAILNNNKEIMRRIYDRPLSAITINNEKINYFNFINSLENKDCNRALKELNPKINLIKIKKIIDEIGCLSKIQKKFYYTMIKKRKEGILDVAYQALMKKRKE